MIILNENIIQDFQQLINYKRLSFYLDDVYDFFKNSYPQIVNFYSGIIDKISFSHFKKLNDLYLESEKINENIKLRRFLLTQYKNWELVEYFDELRNELVISSKIAKFLRSSRTNYNYNSSLEINYTKQKDQSLERILNDSFNDSDYDNNWQTVARRNNLEEVEYNSSSSNKLIFSVNVGTKTYDIKSVVDVMFGEKMYGLDIKKEIEFSNNDVYILSYKNTLQQSVDILSSIEKGTVPEFLNFGRNRFVGENIKSLALQTLVKDLNEVFLTDDTLTNFMVKEIKIDGSDLFLTFEVSSRIDFTIQQTITV